MGKTYREVLAGASSFLEKHGKEAYAIKYLFLARKNWTKTDWLIHMNEPIPKKEEEWIAADIKSLLTDYPPQYLLGFEEFYGHRFKVNEQTLIPRPETEELVELCLNQADKNQALKVVDVGTGTGAIAISLKLACPQWQVQAVDLSAAALVVAKENAKNLGVTVTFFEGDTLEPIQEGIDLLISNPPYIGEEEWELMDPSVRKFEPKMALFAKNSGLEIYERLAKQAQKKLNPEGMIFLEIGFQQGDAVRAIFQKAFPKKQVEVKKDLFGNERMVVIH